ncbi:hypothetical protein CBS63078_9757 [Aspergillus niger]|uniref:uncharacterized protein n=1 Tax=Aspergillus lacticoffeatus (strain CBS 101883) TaxID=1450533 RepID=UPI000D7FC944|nr:uncharacterized protein BO96DRAFT_414387 [Aspergillus niger CBS 101883]KAI2817495.1 hypothetical protein CBS115989_5943 [Aspergillus niger]KAI2826016.1 hypothetical protein CBS133816_7875 [Aspergillus niger]KAI2834951.1 hypothetical protein CBS11232_10666 [Aspergillus niger]KAI2847014.1 hypothetical protein CBS11350_3545 [Aspergillus niger]KAI2877451.1 hypothetical protein CBS115988_3887 [Aspergillus niger]
MKARAHDPVPITGGLNHPFDNLREAYSRKSAEEPTRSPSIARLGIDSSFLLNGPMWIAQDRSAPFRASVVTQSYRFRYIQK